MHATGVEGSGLSARLRSAEQRRDDLEEAIHVIAHDLRGQLGALLGYADLLEQRLDGSDERVRHYADTIATVSERLAAQVDRMLVVYGASGRALRRERVDVSALLHDVADDIRTSGGDALVGLDVAEGLSVEADPILLRLVLDHLLSNAWKAVRGSADPRIEVVGRPTDDGLVEIAVRDNGIGFDEHDSGRLFVPCGRLHDPADFPGDGLGLASVARIVERHGGTVRGQGRPGLGATFSVTLPA
ncbi:hypothetical protein ASD11_15390 [Aeromicrobium sp. Root495]|uniref:sensor histidine kinase n=1 Tax=Aeromicrobium sp. Root495 TaxID=1736550 RepID=UPI0006F8C959|nr:ATP-binding protein [Aeromicrobium sp. Root495]KQY55878.1 hypothetical protein ASD11_15390 [Aeromicrobium sp. Root495]